MNGSKYIHQGHIIKVNNEIAFCFVLLYNTDIRKIQNNSKGSKHLFERIIEFIENAK